MAITTISNLYVKAYETVSTFFEEHPEATGVLVTAGLAKQVLEWGPSSKGTEATYREFYSRGEQVCIVVTITKAAYLLLKRETSMARVPTLHDNGLELSPIASLKSTQGASLLAIIGVSESFVAKAIHAAKEHQINLTLWAAFFLSDHLFPVVSEALKGLVKAYPSILPMGASCPDNIKGSVTIIMPMMIFFLSIFAMAIMADKRS